MNNSELHLFLRKLWHQGLELWLEGDQLRFRASKDLMTSEHMGRLKDNKPAIISALQEQPDLYLGFPLSEGQRSIKMMQDLAPHSVAYNQLGVLQLSRNLNPEVFGAALRKLAERHPMLRATFDQIDGLPRQLIHEDLWPTLSHDYRRELSEKDILAWAQRRGDIPFNLSKGPLLRAHLLTNQRDGNPDQVVLALLAHHIIADYWTMQQLIRELCALYDALSEHREPELPKLVMTYKDFVLHERQMLAGEQGTRDAEYWQSVLAGQSSPVLELPTDKLRPPQQSYHGEEVQFPFDVNLSQQIRASARELQVTPYVMVLSAFQVLLHRYSNEDFIVVGSPMACRGRAGLQQMVGHLTNPVPLCLDVATNPRFDEVVASNRKRVQEALSHQEYPFQQLLDRLQPQRDSSRSPIFQTALSWNQVSLDDEAFGHGRTVERILLMEQRGALYDLVLTGFDNGESFSTTLRYNADIFEANTVKRFARHLAELLRQVTHDPTQPIGTYAYLTSTEREQLADWNRSQRPYPAEQSIAEVFARHVAERPGHTALIFEDQRLSYHQLDRRANQLAHWLHQQAGIAAGDCVAIAIGRSPEFIISQLAALKLGAIYVPVDPDYPDDRIICMLEDSAAPVAICIDPDLEQRLAGLPLTGRPALTVLNLSGQQESVATCSDDFKPEPIEAAGTRTACIFFTSGSTGRPKGVLVPHRAVTRMVVNSNYIEVTPDDRVTQLGSIAFDAASFDIWCALLNGATLVMVSKDVALNTRAFAELIEKEDISISLVTTALFNFFVSEQPDMFRPLRYVLVGGEALDPAKIRAVLQAGAPQHLLNAYGPTENGTISTTYEITGRGFEGNTIPIGKPIANSTVYILDRYGQPTPVGVPGEIHTGGDAVALGYLQRPELTAEKFIADPYWEHISGQQGYRMYGTGDLGRWLPSGDIEILGRIDDQVKIRGFRIELGEIEAAIARLSQVRECTVLARQQDGNKYLAAYVVPVSAGSDNLPALLKRQLKQVLPDYMIPAAFVCLDKLPVTANGKIDKRALPEPEIQASGDYVAPRTELEIQIAGIWQQLLRVERVGLDDHFFDLGGHSLLATQAASRLQETLQRPVTMRDIFTHPTVAELAYRLEHSSATSSDLYPPIERMEHGEAPALSLAQQRIWFVQQLNPDSVAYNMPAAIRFDGEFQHGAMEHAFTRLVGRHEILRTRFHSIDGRAIQVIDPAPTSQTIAIHDLSHLDSEHRDRVVEKTLHHFANTPFDLETGPLVRLEVIREQADQHLLLLNFHHIIADGWSVEVLFRDLGALYQAACKAIDLPAQLPVQYADYSLWQRQWLKGPRLEQQIGYWKQTLAGAPTVLQLPTDYSRPAQQSFGGATVSHHLPRYLVDALSEQAQRQGASLFMMLMTAYAVLLSRYARQNDLCIGFPISGRNLPELEELIGLFVNNLVLRCELEGNPSLPELVGQIRDNMLAAYSNQDVPFDMLVEQLHIERSLAYTPLVQASLVLQNSSVGELVQQYLGNNAKPVDLALTSAKYDINLICYETSDGIEAVLEYASDLFRPDTMQRLLGHFQQILTAMVNNPGCHLNDLPLMETSERQALLEFNQPPTQPYPVFTIHQRFEEAAVRFPDHTAVVCEGHAINYQDLNRRANQVARQLQKLGVSYGDYVGLHFDRGIDLIVAMLAILKTGAAYVPLDPHHPSDRLRYILEDSQAPVLVTTAELANTLAFNGQTLCLDRDARQIEAQSSRNLDLEITPDATVYIIYTSGTTGNPKGCLLTHQNVARLFTATDEWFGFNDHDAWTLFHSFAFDFSVWEIWGALLYGGKLVVVPYWLSRSPEQFYDLLREQRVTVLNQTPSAFSQLIAVDSQRQAQDLALRYVIFGGEALDFNALKNWAPRHGLDKIQLINMYGITETTVHVTYHRVTEADLKLGRSIIGKPIRDLNVYIVDNTGQPCPIGVPGEILVSGAGVSNGYLNRADLTGQKFIANPLIRQLGKSQQTHHSRVYRSGDLARYQSNGEIEYLGRIDHQVKIRGHRIELGEIEAQLTQLDQVREAVVMVREETGDKRLVAYLLPPQGQDSIELTLVRVQLSQNLPDYMLPSAYVVMSEWPLTGNGKIDKNALPAPEGGLPLTAEYVAPRNETEAAIAAIWAEVLGIEQVGVLDNFFELGGHSLLATQVMARIKEQMGSTLELKVIFEHPTVEGLAMQILEAELSALGDDDMADLLAELLDDEDDTGLQE